jgi:AMP deaminase
LTRYLSFNEFVTNSMAASTQGLEVQENKKPASSVAHSVAEHMDAIPEGYAPPIEAHTGEPLLSDSHVSGNDPMMFPGILAREHRNNSSRNLAQSG